MPSRDNLRLKLDVLEARLARARHEKVKRKLNTTKFLVKKTPGTADPQALELEIEQVRKELADRKIHHTANIIRRLLKQFKSTEVLKLGKRLRNASEPQKLAEQLETVKGFELSNEDFVRRMLQKKFPEKLGFPEKRPLNTTENNFYSRFTNKETVREAIEKLSQVLGEIWGETKETEEAPKNEDEDQGTSKNTEPSQQNTNDSSPSTSNLSHVSAEKDTQKENNDTTKAEQQPVDTQEKEIGIDGIDGSDGDNGAADDAFFEEDLPQLPTFQAGYISGSDDSEVEDDPPELKPQRKNRRGQRARRQIWERRYGKRANHVVKAHKEEEQQKLEKEERRRQRELKRERWQKAQLNKKQEAAQPLHPSWEARRQHEEQQKNISFAGKKMKFD